MNNPEKSEKLFFDVCDMLSSSTCGLASICTVVSLQKTTNHNAITYKEFQGIIDPASPLYDPLKADHYRLAREKQRAYLADSVLTFTKKLQDHVDSDKASHVMVQALKLRIDAIRWYLEANGTASQNMPTTRIIEIIDDPTPNPHLARLNEDRA